MPQQFNPAPLFPNPPTAPAQITNQRTWAPVDHSGVSYDLTKLATMPPSLYETDGYKERVGENGWEVERVYLCDWSDLAAAMQWLYGYSTLPDQDAANQGEQRVLNAGGGAGGAAAPTGFIARVIPAQDPYRPYLYCDHVELVEGMGVWVQDPGLNVRVLQGGGGAQFQRLPGMVYAEAQGLGTPGAQYSDGIAKLRATFRQRSYIVQSDADAQGNGVGELGRYVERQAHYAIQGIPLSKVALSGQQLKFTEAPFAGQAIPEPGILVNPTASFHYIWHDVPFYPSDALGACQGGVNAADFDGTAGWPSFGAETLLCQAPEISWKRNICGNVAFTIKWVLDFRPQGWNAFPASDGGFYTATFGGGAPAPDGSNLVYKLVDFGKLFQVPAAAAWL